MDILLSVAKSLEKTIVGHLIFQRFDCPTSGSQSWANILSQLWIKTATFAESTGSKFESDNQFTFRLLI